MKILTIIGARPQFIKASALSRKIAENQGVEEVILHTGQHFDDNMSKVFFEELEIPEPTYNLKINSLSHGAMTGRMLEKIEEVAIKEKPDVILVYGDTNSTLAGALAGKKIGIRIAHVEAGLRSFNMEMPEEINRILTDRISDYLFYPSHVAEKNLKAEGFHNFDCELIYSGDVMLDASRYFARIASEKSTMIDDLELSEYALVTIHRAENTNNKERLSEIVEALNQIHDQLPVVLPLHPRTKRILQDYGLKTNFRIINPVGYLDMIALINKCNIVLTDSGGLQKEAYFFHKPCVTMRDETEWKELQHAGVNIVTGATVDSILNGFKKLKGSNLDFSALFYGDGSASQIILTSLLK